MTLSGATTWGQSRPGSDDNEGYSAVFQNPSITGAPPQIVLCHIQDTHYWSLTLLQRCS